MTPFAVDRRPQLNLRILSRTPISQASRIKEMDPLPTANGSIHGTSCLFNCHLHYLESAGTNLLISSLSFPGKLWNLPTGGIPHGGCQRLERMRFFYGAPPFFSHLHYRVNWPNNQAPYRFKGRLGEKHPLCEPAANG